MRSALIREVLRHFSSSARVERRMGAQVRADSIPYRCRVDFHPDWERIGLPHAGWTHDQAKSLACGRVFGGTSGVRCFDLLRPYRSANARIGPASRCQRWSSRRKLSRLSACARGRNIRSRIHRDSQPPRLLDDDRFTARTTGEFVVIELALCARTKTHQSDPVPCCPRASCALPLKWHFSAMHSFTAVVEKCPETWRWAPDDGAQPPRALRPALLQSA